MSRKAAFIGRVRFTLGIPRIRIFPWINGPENLAPAKLLQRVGDQKGVLAESRNKSCLSRVGL
jgi:hypothetical protein